MAHLKSESCAIHFFAVSIKSETVMIKNNLNNRLWKLDSAGSLESPWDNLLCLLEDATGCYIAACLLQVLKLLVGRTPAWACLDDCHSHTPPFSIFSAAAVMPSHLGLPSWLVLTMLAAQKEEQGQMVQSDWQEWRGWRRASYSCESQTAGSHLDPARAARSKFPSLHWRQRAASQADPDLCEHSTDSPASQQTLDYWLALCQKNRDHLVIFGLIMFSDSKWCNHRS